MSCSACLDKAVAIMSQSRENIFVFVSISYLFWDDQKHTSYENELLTGATLPTPNATNKNINLKMHQNFLNKATLTPVDRVTN